MAATHTLQRSPEDQGRPQLTYIANPHSVHVAVWLKALADCGIRVRIESAMRRQSGVSEGMDVSSLVPNWLPNSSTLRYLWSGVAARFKRRLPGEIVHAHCTSGNGMVAWMSGYPYIVTTYGSEVILAHKRSRFYRWMIHRVLRGAERITATSQQMVDVLVQDHGIDRNRIHLFDLGLNTEVFHSVSPDEQHELRAEHQIEDREPVWVSVKRAIPMNRTIETVQAFEKFCQNHSRGRLVIVCGDDVGTYSHQVKQLIADSPHADRFIILDKWLTAAEVARWLQLADFAISVPISDQMSNAVLEAMACGAVPILLDIEGYRSLKERRAAVHWIDDCTVETLTSAFRQSAALPYTELTQQQQAAAQFIDDHYANRKVWEHFQNLYDLPTQHREAVRHAA